MSFWIPDQIRSACGGTWLARPAAAEPNRERAPDSSSTGATPPAPMSGVSTDTRSLRPGQVFIALRGENHDGHRFLADAARLGATILVIDDPAALAKGGFTPAVGVLKVADTGKALLRLAAAYRKTLDRTRVIAVCGSNGKTTTTRLIEAALRDGGGLRGTASAKSFNNAVGVPLTILAAKPTDQYLICEVGTNARGEIAMLGEVVQPDIAVITSIGREHLAGLGDLAGVAREEAAILQFLRPASGSGGVGGGGGGGCAIVTADSPQLAEHLKGLPNVVTFGSSSTADLRLTAVTPSRDPEQLGLSFTVNGRLTCRLSMIGDHNALNALAALAVGRRLGLDEQRIAAAFAGATGPEMRMQPMRVETHDGPIVVLNDAYNANPDSMLAAIRTLAQMDLPQEQPAARRVAVLGDMLELGSATARQHEMIAQELALVGSRTIAMVVLVGPHMAGARDALRGTGWPADRLSYVETADAGGAGHIAATLHAGDVVLLKGSRRMRLERVLEALRTARTHGAASDQTFLVAPAMRAASQP